MTTNESDKSVGIEGDADAVDDTQVEFRDPKGWRENLLANIRPPAAIPAVFVFILFVLLPLVSQSGGANEGSMLGWVVTAGIVVSCGLAVAAGYCSFVPHISWLLLAAYGLRFHSRGLLSDANFWLLSIGVLVVLLMFFVQIWRVQNGKFSPKIKVLSDLQN